MGLLFNPIISLMNRLTYPKKLALIGTLIIFVVAVLIYQITQHAMREVDFSRKELVGIEYIKPVIKLMTAVQQYRNVTDAYYASNNIAKTKIVTAEQGVDQAMEVLTKVDRQLGSTLNTTTTLNELKSQWESLKGVALKVTPPQNFAKISDFIVSVQNLIILASDNSNLTLDPDIDTYYLMDSYVVKLPNLLEQTAQLRDIGVNFLTTKEQHEDYKKQLGILQVLIASHSLPGIKMNLQKVMQANPAAGVLLNTASQKAILDIDYLLTHLIKPIHTSQSSITSAEFSEKSESALQATSNLTEMAVAPLASLIEARVDRALNNLYMNLGIASISLLLLLILFFGIYASMIQGIKSLVAGANKLAAGDLTAQIQLANKDELAQVAASFNSMRDTIAGIIIEAQTVVDAAKVGDLSKQIDLVSKQGFARELGAAINQMNQNSRIVVEEIVNVLAALAKADLNVKLDNKYQGIYKELSENVNTTIESLQKLISEVKMATTNINMAAKEIASGNSDLSRRTEEQAAALEQTFASIEELMAAVKQNAENAKHANQLAHSASNVALKGGSVVGQVVDTMNHINESSKKVADISTVIDGIAFQTNILALNAAVEAARAGEQGRGFAIVANEVRNLAQRSATAAKEIKALVNVSVAKVDNGTKLVSEAGETMHEIVNAVQQVTTIIGDISTASIQQSAGIEQVNQAVTQMDEVTQQNAALVEEAAAAAESLEAQTQHMENLIKVFRVNENSAATFNNNHYASSLEKVSSQVVVPQTTISKIKAGIRLKKGITPSAPISKNDQWEEF